MPEPESTFGPPARRDQRCPPLAAYAARKMSAAPAGSSTAPPKLAAASTVPVTYTFPASSNATPELESSELPPPAVDHRCAPLEVSEATKTSEPSLFR